MGHSMNSNSSNAIEKYTLIIGTGYFERELINFLKERRKLTVIDIRLNHIEKLAEKMPDVEFISGDASSLVTWKKINQEALAHIIITLRDPDIVQEICRIARDVFELDIMIIVVSYGDYDTEILEKYNVTIIKPMQMGIDIVATLLERNVSWPINIGNRQGEIVEVQVLKYSHLVGVKLRHIRPVSWSVALIYKDGRPLLPSPDTRISVGDRLIIVGEPKVVKGVVDTLSKGEPNFPLQFGQNISVYSSSQFPKLMNEAVYFYNNTLAKKLNIMPVSGKSLSGLAERLKNENIEFITGQRITHIEDIKSVNDGLVVLPRKHSNILNPYYKRFFKNAVSPIIFTNGVEKYDRIVISLNTETPSFALEIGVELAKLIKVPFSILYITAIENMRGQKETQYLNFRKNIVSDFELTEGVTMEFKILEGNPVIETVNAVNSIQNQNVLLVLAFDPEDKITFFNPNIQYLITKKLKSSVLAIPVEDTHA